MFIKDLYQNQSTNQHLNERGYNLNYIPLRNALGSYTSAPSSRSTPPSLEASFKFVPD